MWHPLAVLPSALAILAILALLSPPRDASGSPRALVERVDAASVVCLGRVIETIELPTPAGMRRPPRYERERLRIARVQVERVLKGDPALEVVHHEAWDADSAAVGQRALLFLGPGELERDSDAVRALVHERIGTDLLLRPDGAGVLGVSGEPGDERVGLYYLPLAIASGDSRSPLLSDVVRYVAELVEFSPEALAVQLRSGTHSRYAPAGSFELRVLPDGRARLARELGPGEVVSTFTYDPEAWSTLRARLEPLVAGRERRFGGRGARVRSLVIRAGGTLELHEPTGGLSVRRNDPRRATVLDALEAWALVRASFECPGCADHVERDRAWLAENR